MCDWLLLCLVSAAGRLGRVVAVALADADADAGCSGDAMLDLAVSCRGDGDQYVSWRLLLLLLLLLQRVVAAGRRGNACWRCVRAGGTHHGFSM
jgi:hypothetical protein